MYQNEPLNSLILHPLVPVVVYLQVCKKNALFILRRNKKAQPLNTRNGLVRGGKVGLIEARRVVYNYS